MGIFGRNQNNEGEPTSGSISPANPPSSASGASPISPASPIPSLDGPIYPGYTMQRRQEISALTDKYVPDRGPSSTVQGELIRAVDKLWFEGQDNGNVNWDFGFEYFCDLLEEYLLAPGVLSEDERSKAQRDIAILRHCGWVAYRWKPEWMREESYDALILIKPAILTESEGQGPLPDLAYTHDDLYQHLMDCVATFALAHPEPIPYLAPDWLRR